MIRRFVFSAITVTAAALFAPATSPADTVISTDGTTMVVQGSPGESSQMLVIYSPSASAHGVTDQPNGVSETSPNCSESLLTVSCTGITAIRVLAGDGNDSVSMDPAGTAVSPIVPVEAFGDTGDDILRGGTAAVNLIGGAGADTLLGRGGNDNLQGGDDEDYLHGEEGDDALGGGPGADFLRGGPGDDGMNGFEGADVLRGELGNDELLGSTGPDFLRGEAGDDLLRGEGGADVLLGESGVDILNAKDRLRDRVIDCGAGKDPRAKRDRRRDPNPKSCARVRRRH